jgi:hypothetical protein
MPSIKDALNDFRACVRNAPEGCYDDAKRLYAVIGTTCDTLMQDVRGMGLKADNCDLIFAVEAAVYNYVRQSNPNATVFPSAEGFGAALDGPARDRVLAQLARDRDFLRDAQSSRNPISE